MKITKLSNDLSPLSKGLRFAIDGEGENLGGKIVEIFDTTKDEVVATQQLPKTTYTEVNIAPYVAQLDHRTPSTSFQAGIRDAAVRSYHLRCEGIESEHISVSVNRCDIELPMVLTSMPLVRKMGASEHDEVVVMCNPGDEITALITANDSDELFLNHTTESGVAIINFSISDFSSDVKALDVEISCNDTIIENLHYDIVPLYRGATRVAWVAEDGAIERYTFPTSQRSQSSVKCAHLNTREGIFAVEGESKKSISLRSRYEPQATVEQLAKIASSERVWIENEGRIQSVEVESDALEFNLFNEPSSIVIELCVEREEVAI